MLKPFISVIRRPSNHHAGATNAYREAISRLKTLLRKPVNITTIKVMVDLRKELASLGT
jgi:hypothetical protein